MRSSSGAQRGLHSTADGRLLYEEVERSFRGLELIDEAADAIRGRRVGRIRAIAMPVYADGFLSGVLGRFLAANPGVTVHLEASGKDGVVEGISAEQYDLGITTLPVPQPGIDLVELFVQEAVCVLPPGHSLAARKTVRLADLEGEAFLTVPPGSPFRLLVDRMLRAAGLAPAVVAEARTQRAVCNMVAAGAGLSIVDRSIAGEFLPERLAARPLLPKMEWTVGALMPARRARSVVLEALLGELSLCAHGTLSGIDQTI